MKIPVFPQNGDQMVGRFKRIVGRSESGRKERSSREDVGMRRKSSGSRQKLWRRQGSTHMQDDLAEPSSGPARRTSVEAESVMNEDLKRPSWKNTPKRSVPISTSLHGENQGKRGGLSGSLHGAISGARSTLSNSLHGIRGGTNNVANMNALKAEVLNLRGILNAYKQENDELLQDAQILLEENEYLTQELVQVCEENEMLQDDKHDLKEQLEEAQFEQEEAQLKYREHMATCANKSPRRNGEGHGSRNNRRGSIFPAAPIGGSHSTRRDEQSEPVHKPYTRRSSDDGELHQLAFSSLQAEMTRKQRTWDEERCRMQAQMNEYQDEMEKLRDVAHQTMKHRQHDVTTISHFELVMQKCESCKGRYEALLEEKRNSTKDLEEYLALKKQNECCVNRRDSSCGVKIDAPKARGGLGRAMQGLLDKSFNAANDTRSKSVCLGPTADGEPGNASRSKSVVSVGRRVSTVSTQPDSDFTKCLSRLRKSSSKQCDGHHSNNSSLLAEENDETDKTQSTSLDSFLESDGRGSASVDGSAEGNNEDSRVTNHSEEASEVSSKAYSTSEWNAARQLGLEKQFSGFLPPLKLSLNERYCTDTMDESSWLVHDDEEQNTAPQNVLSDSLAIATEVLENKRDMKTQARSIRDLLNEDELKKKKLCDDTSSCRPDVSELSPDAEPSTRNRGVLSHASRLLGPRKSARRRRGQPNAEEAAEGEFSIQDPYLGFSQKKGASRTNNLVASSPTEVAASPL